MAGRKQQDIPIVTEADSAPASAPDPQIRRRLLEALSGSERYSLFADDVARAFEVNVESARSALRRISDESAWRPAGFPGSRVLVSPELAANGTVIAYLPVGMSIPVHGHAERELTFVLDGELLDDAQQRFGAGELLDMQVGTEHAIRVVGEHACLAVFRRARH
jgi:hypothetical protein